jgi:hypothetical protein
MNVIDVFEYNPKNHYESFRQEQKYEVVNGKVIEDTNIKEYNKNGEIVIEGTINGKQILYSNVDATIVPYNEFSKKVHFMDKSTPKSSQSKRKMTKKSKSSQKKKTIRKRNK